MQTTISCPHCNKPVDVHAALIHEISVQNEKDLAVEKSKLQQQFEEKRKNEIDRSKAEATFQYKQEIESLKSLLKDQAESLKVFRDNELQLRKERALLEQRSQSVELEIQRKLDEERNHIMAKARSQEQEAINLQMKEKDKALQDLKIQLDEMKKRMEQGSVQLQGEVQELEIEKTLCEVFPFDLIEEVGKGVNGSDLNQIVRNNRGKECGIISYESKRTKSFNDKWIEKLKDDMLRVKADFGIIVTETMPSNMPHFGLRNGVWICSFHEFKGLAFALRESLIRIAALKTYQSNSDAKMKSLYDYLTGNEFAQQIDIIVKTFVGMKADLDQEKRAFTKIWKNREKKIERVIQNTIDFYGSIQGLSGDQLPDIATMQLTTGDGAAEYSEV